MSKNINQAAIDTADAISLRDIANLGKYARLFLLGVTLAGAAAGHLWAQKTATYKGQGFYQFNAAIPVTAARNEMLGETAKPVTARDAVPGIAVPNYKRYAAVFWTKERFHAYIKDNKLEGTAGLDELEWAFKLYQRITHVIEPVFETVKSDAYELSKEPYPGAPKVVGFRLAIDSRSPELAKAHVKLLGDYIMDSIIYVICFDSWRYRSEELRGRNLKLERAIILNRNGIAGYSLKAPPVNAADARREIAAAQREQKRNEILIAYYDRVHVMLETAKLGDLATVMLQKMDGPIKDKVFSALNMNDDIVREAWNLVSAENREAWIAYVKKTGFVQNSIVSAPTDNHALAKVAAGALLGLFLALSVLLLRAWWRQPAPATPAGRAG
jgi:hypothetical protein